jgi:hypothetical protein
MKDLMRRRVQRVWKSIKKLHLNFKEVHSAKRATGHV